MDVSQCYKLTVLLGDPATKPLWYWDRWSLVFPELDRIVNVFERSPHVECFQFELRNNSARGIPVRFGRIGWKNGHAKWTHESPITSNKSHHWQFSYFGVMLPSLATCVQRGFPPDFFFAMSDVRPVHEPHSFKPAIVMAMPNVSFERYGGKNVVDKLKDITKAKLVAHQLRPWAHHNGENLYSGSIGDMPTVHLFNTGDIQKEGPQLSILRQWPSDQPWKREEPCGVF